MKRSVKEEKGFNVKEELQALAIGLPIVAVFAIVLVIMTNKSKTPVNEKLYIASNTAKEIMTEINMVPVPDYDFLFYNVSTGIVYRLYAIEEDKLKIDELEVNGMKCYYDVKKKQICTK